MEAFKIKLISSKIELRNCVKLIQMKQFRYLEKAHMWLIVAQVQVQTSTCPRMSQSQK